MRTFKEYTAIGHDDHGNYCEIMLDVSTNDGKIVSVYTYKTDLPKFYNEETGKDYKIKIKPSQNPLFVYISTSPIHIVKLLDNKGFIIGNEDEETNDQTFTKFLQYYNVNFN